MKRLLIVVVVAVVLLLAGIFIFALVNANSLIASFKPELEKMASSAAGGDVQIGAIDVSVFPNTYLMLKNLELAGADSAPNERLALKEIRLDVKLLELLKKRLHISRLTLLAPEILLIKDASGIRVAGLPKKAPEGTTAPKRPADLAESKTLEGNAAPPAAPIDIALEEIRVEGGTIVLSDTVLKTEQRVDRIEFVSGIALSGQEILIPSFDFSARALEKIDLQARGKQVTFKDNILTADSVAVTLLGNTINLSGSFDVAQMAGSANAKGPEIRIPSLFPLVELAPEPSRTSAQNAIKEFNPSGALGLDAKGAFKGESFQAEAILSLINIGATAAGIVVSEISGAFDARSSGDRSQVSTENLSLKLNGQPVKIQLSSSFAPPVVDVSKLKISLFSGEADIKANARLEGTQPLTTTFSLKGINASQALAALGQKPEAQKFTATIDDVNGTASLPLTGNLPAEVSADVKAALSQVELKGFNLAGSLLRSVKDLPFIPGDLYESIPANERAALDSPNTVISSLTASVKLSNGRIFTPDLRAKSDLFNLEAEGTIGLDSSIDLRATILFSPAFSSTIVKKVKELNALLDKQGRLVIPLSIKGIAPKLVVLPNTEHIMKLGAGQMLKDKAGDLLGKALGGGKGEGSKKGLGGMFGF